MGGSETESGEVSGGFYRNSDISGTVNREGKMDIDDVKKTEYHHAVIKWTLVREREKT